MQQKSNSLREELHTELERIINDIIKFKVHIQSSLEGYEEFVAQEVERECEEQEAAEAAEAADTVAVLILTEKQTAARDLCWSPRATWRKVD